MTAADYPVEFPYGATDGLYYCATKAQSANPALWIGPYHRGDDRFTLVGTSVIVNGAKIALTGESGRVSGPHLHTGRFESGVDTDPKGRAFSLPDPVRVFDVGHDDKNGNWVKLIDYEAMVWVYLHLSKVYVTKGQLIKKGDNMGEVITKERLDSLYKAYWHELPTQADYDNWVGKDELGNLVDGLASDPRRVNYYNKSLLPALAAYGQNLNKDTVTTYIQNHLS